MKKGFFGSMFDMNRDGKLDSFERAMDFMAFEEMMKDSSGVQDDLEDDSEEELELAGLDPDDYDFY